MRQGKLRSAVAVLAACGALAPLFNPAALVAQQVGPRAFAQVGNPFGAGFVQFGGAGGEQLSGVFLPTERTARRRLDQARRLIDEQRFGEAARLLDAILANHEDSFFQPDGDDTSYRSLKAEARRLIGALPEAGRNAYQLQFGARAKNLLEQAAQAGNAAGLAEVARRFFHTDAGYEATLLLGQYHLDHNRPLAAALAFQQLADAPRAAARFEPAASVLAATSWARAAMPDKARRTLAELKQQTPDARVKLAGRDVPLFAPRADALAWLRRNVGEGRAQAPALAEQWTMFRGGGGRNAQSAGGRPLLTPRWRVRTANDPTIEKLVSQMRASYQRQQIPALPSLHPLAVEDVVLMRTARHLLAVDFETGKRVWKVPPRRDDAFEQLIEAGRGEEESGELSRLVVGLEQRMWDDAAYGTLSSDGERVFVLQDLDLLIGASSQNRRARLMIAGNPFGARRAGGDAVGPQPYNRLAAYELATEGKLVWQVGGEHGAAPELAEAFFLGPPLPLSGSLYVLAEIKGGIRLVVLDAESGKPQWSQQLANLERDILASPFRRLAGATPSFTDGVLVCPTSAGAVVAVDLSTRSLLWAYKYPVKSLRERRQMAMMMMRGMAISQLRGNESWTDASATVVEGRVLLTPVESDQLFCLDLLDGSLLWSRERGESLYVACVHDGKVVLVGAHEVQALNLADGEPAWNALPDFGRKEIIAAAPGQEVKLEPKSLKLPDGAMPSGRGYYSGDYYYLPLTSAEVVKIDLNEGKIVARAKSRSGHVPGNLICHRGEVISQGVDFVETFFQVEALQERVRLALEKNPDDARALARRGELEFAAGKLQQSIASLRRSFELDPNDLTRELYVRSLLEGLRTDFAANRDLAKVADRLAERPQRRAELVRLLAVGLQRLGETRAAFENYLQLIDLSEGHDPLEEVEEHLSVRRGRWIQAQLTALYNAADDAERKRMDAAVAQRYAALGEEPSAARLRTFLDHFGGHQLADAARLRLAARLLDEGESLACELLLLRLTRSDDAGHQRAATAMMAELLRKEGRVEDAAIYYRRLAGPLADAVCLDGKTGRELVAELSPNAPVAAALAGDRSWPRGKVVASTGKSGRANRARRRLNPVELRGQTGPFHRDRTVAFDQQSQALVGHGGLGQVEYQIPLNPPGGRRTAFVNPTLNYGKAYGHLLLVSMGNQIMALDTLNTRRASWQNVLWREDLTEQLPGVTNRQRVQVKRINLPGGGARFQAEDGQGNPLGALGPATAGGVVFQRYRSLRAVDPITGETLWIRRHVPAGCDLFGDEKLLVAVPSDATEALILDPRDGALLGKRPVPPLNERLATVGPRVLRLDQSNPWGPALALLDVWTGETIWKRSFATGTKFRRLGDDLLGAMQRDGRFVLLALADGQPLVEAQLLAEPQLTGIYLQQSRERFLLITNHPPVDPKKDIHVMPAPGGLNNPLISGRVYAFDRATGQPQWPVPAVVEQHGLLLPQPSDLPVLVFVRHLVNPKAGGRSRTKTSILCLDKRTGRAVYQKDDFSFGTGFYHLEGDRGAGTVAVRLPSLTVELKYTDEPIPPEPPLQANQSVRRPPRAASVLGSLFRAFGRAAIEVQGGVGNNNPFGLQQKNPFGGNPGNNMQPFGAPAQPPGGPVQRAQPANNPRQQARQNIQEAQREAQQNVQEEKQAIQEAAREAQEAPPDDDP